MARKNKDDGAEGAEAPAKGGKSNLIPAIVLAIGLLGGGFFMSQRSAPAPAEAAEVEPVEEATEEVLGPVYALESITLNLADGHYLKVGLALQMAPPEGEEEAASGHGSTEEEATMPAGEQAPALDATITLFGAHTSAEVGDPTAREELKHQLVERIAEAYHGEVVDVYFTEFVVQ